MEAVNHQIATRMASENAPRIPEVTRHLVDAGGKRLRPILTLAAARLCGYAGEDHVKLAATVEFIHTATLLHDDVVDESAQRRGRPTANLLWDNKSSVLVGDYLFARSFQLMTECGSMRVLEILADASATIAEGEVLQLSTGGSLDVEVDTYLKMIHGKTAALFAAASEVGGVIAAAPEAQVQALRAYGRDLGMAFQIVDDVLDYGGSSARLGKTVGDDFREGKMTLPVLIAVAEARAAGDEAALAFWKRCIERPSKQQEGDLEEALRRLRETGALDAATTRARDYTAAAVGALDQFPDMPLKTALADVAEFVVSRLS
ncbi:polyprenyl synthetase family protein [Rhodovulum sp. DZ06]|uniref:polyprenyl synthetase family protein n=1 Tax=Rhodovulum sp. DZ06 TaxID=3425126 RepID=UPI003D32B435